MWDGVAVALVFGLVLAFSVLAVFKYAVGLAERVMFAAFARAQKDYSGGSAPHLNQWDTAESVEDLMRSKRGSEHPVPDIPPHPDNLGRKQDPTSWVSSLGTERIKHRGS